MIVDHLADAGRDAYVWSQELERLRDPSHWLSMTLDGARSFAARAGLSVERELIVPLELDFDDWLARGHADAASQALVEEMLTDRPADAECFEVVANGNGTRTLRLRMWAALLRR